MSSMLATLVLPSLGLSLAPDTRVPAVPLVTHDPYFSVWSCADQLTDDPTRHWTGREHPLTLLLRVDDATWRLMGTTPSDAPVLPQTELAITPTRTTCTFANEAIRATVTFLSPLLPDDLDALGRPVTYIGCEVASLDGREHRVVALFTASSLLAVDGDTQPVEWYEEQWDGLAGARVGTVAQPVLARRGDDLRIDWGWCWLVSDDARARVGAYGRRLLEASFVATGAAPEGQDARKPRAPEDDEPCLWARTDLGTVGERPVESWTMLGYDDEYSVRYFAESLRPWWRTEGVGPHELFSAAAAERVEIDERCARFDEALTADLSAAGGDDYAAICALAYRQSIAGHKLVRDSAGGPMLFSKECFSNGCMATVDVTYPSAPLFIALSPTLTKALLAPALEYGSSPRWTFPFAPHDLGQYPRATGQVYGGGERTEDNQMPVEESGNMLILLAALARAEGNADYAGLYWPTITRWAEYLREKGLDPENQLCTDDFTGHLAHNANLSAKAIVALACYGQLAERLGKAEEAAEYGALAREFAAKWVELAEDGDHTRLAFDKPGTWSMKYNLVWDRVLDLGVFPPEVTAREIAFYKGLPNRYGLPLDPRATFTKSDWLVWVAALATSEEDFRAFTAPLALFLEETPDRVPFTDWYDTISGKMVGFRARTVIGGVFIKMLTDPAMWAKWVARDPNPDLTWAPFPTDPELEPIIPTAQTEPLAWRWTTETPAGEWWAQGYDDSAWPEGAAGFGTRGTPGAVIGTEWSTPDIWIRRSFELPGRPEGDVRLMLHHDEDAEIWINGVLAARAGGFTTGYDAVEITKEARAALREGANVIAIRCHQTTGGQYIDCGLVRAVRR